MQKSKDSKSKVDEMQGVIDEHRQLQEQLHEAEAKVSRLNDDLRKAQKDLEMFEPYREFVMEVVPKTWTIELQNKYAIDGLRKLDRIICQRFGGQLADLSKDQEELAKGVAYRMNRLVEKSIQYITMNQTNMNIFIRKMIREPGDDVEI